LQFSAGCPQLNLARALSNNFVVQYSTNLAGTNWMNLLSVTNLSANPYQFQDPAGAGQPARFFSDASFALGAVPLLESDHRAILTGQIFWRYEIC
jgi:hypothetical protein